jgi:hypothetical protein
MTLWIERVFPRQAARLRHAALSAATLESELSFPVGLPSSGLHDRDRFPHDRRQVLQQAVEAWRGNPLGRRIVGLTSQYVLGDGVTVSSQQPAADRFLKQFWEHRLNRMATRCSEWCDELTRTGNLFVLVSTDPAGMSYVRAVPTAGIERIEAQPHDIEQPLAFWPVRTPQELEPSPWPAYDETRDHPDASGGWPVVMLHYAINRPVGAQWGESDLAPLLRWLARYANWLEDRARLNRYRNAFLFMVNGRWPTAAQRIARQNELNANPPRPGAILVSDESEQWSILSPKLESNEANSDGLALKKMIAAGAGIPLHFLAEPESSTRTTAEAAGGPTYRHFEQRQRYFLWVVQDVLRVVLARRAQIDNRVPQAAALAVSGADISSRDNAVLAMAATQISAVFQDMRDRGLIDDRELLRMVYRYAGEPADVDGLLAGGAFAPPVAEGFKGMVEGTGRSRPAAPDVLKPDRMDVKSTLEQGGAS